MAILVVGSVAFDTVRTPAGRGRELPGGSAAHFSMAASFFAPVRLLGVVGEDFTEEHEKPFLERGVDLRGLERRKGRTFRWAGEYGEDLSDPRTLGTELNVLADFEARVPEGWADTPVVFLANLDPDIHLRVLEQVGRNAFVAADTMNYWIASKPEAVRRVLGRVRVAFLNEGEIRQLTGRRNLLDAADEVRALGPDTVVVKRGENGVVAFHGQETISLPAFPLRRVVDPTGAGDAFAGGFLGLAVRDQARHAGFDVRRATAMGCVLASFQVEAFSFERLRRLRHEEILERFEALRELTRFEPGRI
jgi:sugar/nucleoside kinase (ribokinase family)